MKLVDEYTNHENSSNILKGYMSCNFVSICNLGNNLWSKIKSYHVNFSMYIEINLSNFGSTLQTRDLHNICYFIPSKKMLYDTYCLTYSLFWLHYLASIVDIDGKVNMKHAMHDWEPLHIIIINHNVLDVIHIYLYNFYNPQNTWLSTYDSVSTLHKNMAPLYGVL